MTYSSTQDNCVPLVSVLCRTVGRESLKEALESVNQQDWPRLEVILVDALNQGAAQLPIPKLRADIAIQVVSDDHPLDRPHAANAALDAARGEYLIFLDDDDWIAPDQVSQLIRQFDAHPDLAVCYSAARKARPDGTMMEDVIAVPFNHTVLRRDNFIPIHAALFRRSLLDHGCRFDESLPVYEDWDFWLQAAEHGSFLLSPHEGAYYRMGGDSQTMLEEHAARYDPHHPMGQARARLLHKWRSRWSGEDWNTLLGLVDQSQQVVSLHGELSRAQRDAQALETQIRQWQRNYQELESAHLSLNLAHDQLDRDVKAILNSFSWRVTAPYRWARHRLARLTAGRMQSVIAPERTTPDEVRQGDLQAGILVPATDNLTFTDTFTLHAWAWSQACQEADSQDGAVPDHSCVVVASIDGEVQHHQQFPEHSAVTIDNAEDARRIGFAHLLDIRHLTPGRHVLTLQVTDQTGNDVTIQRAFVRQDSQAQYRRWRNQHLPDTRPAALPARLNIVLFVPENSDARTLQQTLDSLASLKGDNWRVIVDSGPVPADSRFADVEASAPPKLRQRLEPMTPELKPSCLSGELLMFLTTGDRLSSDYLAQLAAHWDDDTLLLYSDHDHYDEHGEIHSPVFTFAWSPDLLRSRDYIGGVFVLRADALTDWPARHHSAWRYGCLLDLLDAEVPPALSNTVRIPKVLWSEADTTRQSPQTSLQALRDAIQRRAPDAEVLSPAIPDGDPYCHYVRWPLAGHLKVSVIIPTTGNLRFLKPCLESLAQTDYPDVEIIILNNSRGKYPEGIQYARDWGALVVDCDEEFNWSRLNNIGVDNSSGEILLFLNDDIEIIDPQWLAEMVRQAVRDDVATVGSLLLYPNGAIQHAGVFLVDHGGGARHLFHRQLPGEGIYLQLDQCVREVSANTGACLMIMRERFEQLGRFDESLAVVGNDIDLCLRALEAGWRNIWTPHSRLIHHESVSRQSKPIGHDEKSMWQRWEHRFRGGDPWFNPSLSLQREDCALAELTPSAITAPATAAGADTPGVNMVAYIRASMGVGEAARGNAAALEAAGIDFGIINYERGNPSRMDNLRWQHREIDQPRHDINLVHINADHIATVIGDLGREWFSNRYNIGFWAWEMPDFPDRWLDAFALVDEVWVPSTYVNQAIATKSPVPVITIPHVVQIDMGSARRYGRADFGIPDSAFTFISMFDTHSVAQRKNPFGSIHAFQQAFSPADERVHLVIKINNADDASLRVLKECIGNYRNIQLIDQHLDRAQIDSLINSCDCYVSLHHAEGFGLGPAEAMAMGKVALLTNWSGNTEYMTADNCIPVAYTIKPLGADYGPYEAYQHWAAPDLDHAAAEMQALIASPEKAKIIGTKARDHIERYFSADAIGKRMRARLSSIQRRK